MSKTAAPYTVQLVRHAQRFGPEGVLETAVEQGFNEDALTALIVKLDAIEDEKARAARFRQPKNRRVTARTRAQRLLGIEPEEGKE